MTRNIKVYTTVGVSGTIETNARTLGELKPLLSQREINFSNMKMLVGETKNELVLDEALLPEGDFKLYLMPAKTKSGVDFEEMEETLDRIENKLNTILDKLSSASSLGSSVAKSAPAVSAEDAREIEELKRLAGQSNNEWD